MGRGKKMIEPSLFQIAIEEEELSATPAGEYITSVSRLMPKRFFTIVVPDDAVKEVVDAIIEANSDGNPGDGKIFVLPIYESIRVRDGELQVDSESY